MVPAQAPVPEQAVTSPGAESSESVPASRSEASGGNPARPLVFLGTALY